MSALERGRSKNVCDQRRCEILSLSPSVNKLGFLNMNLNKKSNV